MVLNNPSALMLFIWSQHEYNIVDFIELGLELALGYLNC